MEIEEKEINNIIILEFSGILVNLDDAGPLSTRLHELASRGNSKVILDLGNAKYISDIGFGVIVERWTQIKESGGVLKFTNVHGILKNKIENTSLNEFFEFFDSTNDAILSFK